MIKLPNTLPPESLPARLPHHSKWLSGECAGSWFVLEKSQKNQHYSITRFSPNGIKECEGLFYANQEIDLERDFEITYPAHCTKVTILHNNQSITLSISFGDSPVSI